MPDSTEEWVSSVEAALSVGVRLAGSKKEFNQACDHAVQLLVDASMLLENGSHATATFIAITALEEISKVHMGMYRRSTTAIARQKDPLYKHREKHRIAVGPTVAMGTRLQRAIGEARMNELIEIARRGELVRLREASLYIEQNGKTLNSPSAVIPKTTARELLLLSVEAFDDALVGYTDHTFELRSETDRIFARWENPESLR